jgi:tetratricopeptide (TPR) repeat protein
MRAFQCDCAAIDASRPSRRSPEPSYYVEKARIQVWVGQCKEAQESAERALVGNDGYALAHAVRGWALNCLEDYLQAETAVKTALELDPNNALAHAYMAEILINKDDSGQGDLGDLDKSIEECVSPIRWLPTVLGAALVICVMTKIMKNPSRCIKPLNLNKRIPDLFLYLGYNYKALNDYNNAVESFSETNSLNPGDAIPDLELSRIYAQVGDFGKAVQ